MVNPVPIIKDLLAAGTQPMIVTVNAWNERPEGSVLEQENGYGHLEAIKASFGTKTDDAPTTGVL